MTISKIFIWIARFLVCVGTLGTIFGADLCLIVSTFVHASTYVVGSFVLDKLELIHDKLDGLGD